CNRFVYNSIIRYLSYIPFFFKDPSSTKIYTLSLHDALPIYAARRPVELVAGRAKIAMMIKRRLVVNADDFGLSDGVNRGILEAQDRKSTRLNSSHVAISYAVFCLKKKTSASVLPRIALSHRP